MNTMKATSANGHYTSKPFFKFTLKNTRHNLLLYSIIMILAILLPCVLLINDFNTEHYLVYSNPSIMINDIQNIYTTCGIVGIFASLLIAVFAGMSALSYVNSKQPVSCYHSFPITRERMYVIETASRAIYFVIPYLICMLLAMLIMNIAMPSYSNINTEYLKYIPAGLLVFAYLYSVIVFSGGLTGTSPVKFIVAMLIILLPTGLYSLIIGCASIGITNLNEGYYLCDKVFRVIFTPYRVAQAISGIPNQKYAELYPLIYTLIPESAVFYIGGLFLHKYRRSEASGNTVIWKPVFNAIKYLVIFTSTLLGIGIFGSNFIFGGSKWVLFGMIFGLIVSFMLTNSILYRSSKALFKNIKGLVVMGIISLVITLILPFDIFNLNDKLYSANNTSSLAIKLQYTDEIVFTDREVITKLVNLLDNDKLYNNTKYTGETTEAYEVYDVWSKEDPEIVSKLFKRYDISFDEYGEKYYDGYLNDMGLFIENYNASSIYLIIIQTPKFGIPYAKDISIPVNSEFWDEISASPELINNINKINEYAPDDIFNVEINLLGEYIYNDFDRNIVPTVAAREYGKIHGSLSYSEEDIKDILNDIAANYNYNSSLRENSVLIGNMRINYNEFYPIYTGNVTEINLIFKLMNLMYSDYDEYIPYPTDFTSENEVIRYIVSEMDAAYAMIDKKTGELRLVDDKLVPTLLSSAATLDDDYLYITRAYSNVRPANRYCLYLSIRAGNDTLSRNVMPVYIRDGALDDASLDAIFNGTILYGN